MLERVDASRCYGRLVTRGTIRSLGILDLPFTVDDRAIRDVAKLSFPVKKKKENRYPIGGVTQYKGVTEIRVG